MSNLSRLFGFKPQASPKAVLPAISQEGLDALMSSLNGHQWQMSEVLTDLGYSSNLNNLNLHAHWTQDTYVDFSGCNFQEVVFTGEFSHTKFNGEFLQCEFSHVALLDTILYEATFEQCAFLDAHFAHDLIQGCYIEQSWFVQSSFQDSTVADTLFDHSIYIESSDAPALMSYSNNVFVECGVVNSSIFADIELNNVQTGQPLVGVVGYSDWFDAASHALGQLGADHSLINPYGMSYEAKQALQFEVSDVFKHLEVSAWQAYGSIPNYILNLDLSSVQQLKEYAKSNIDGVDGLWIPGDGDDVHPEFYHQSYSQYTYTSNSYVKELVEFALIQEAFAQHKPVFGVCHGSQMINVYLGGDLNQNVSWQTGYQDLEVQTFEGPIGSSFGEMNIGAVMHHQAMDHVAQDLEVVATYDNVVKAVQSISGSPVYLTQFHPEYLIDDSNIKIIESFINACSHSDALSTSLELSDLLVIENEWAKGLEIQFDSGDFHFVHDKITPEPAVLDSVIEQSWFQTLNQYIPEVITDHLL